MCSACLAGRLILPQAASDGRNHAGPQCSKLTCRLDWGEDVLTLMPTAERFNPVDGSLLFRGLSAKTGIFEGEMSKIMPHLRQGTLFAACLTWRKARHVPHSRGHSAGVANVAASLTSSITSNKFPPGPEIAFSYENRRT